MSVTITRRLEFDAGHRLLRHEGKCRNVHGHRYVVHVMCDCVDLDAVGRVIDFSVVKQLLGSWIDDHLDHGFIAQRGDPIVEFLIAQGCRVHVMPTPPTAENIAGLLLDVARRMLSDHRVSVLSVRVDETPNCWAERS